MVVEPHGFADSVGTWCGFEVEGWPGPIRGRREGCCSTFWEISQMAAGTSQPTVQAHLQVMGFAEPAARRASKHRAVPLLITPSAFLAPWFGLRSTLTLELCLVFSFLFLLLLLQPQPHHCLSIQRPLTDRANPTVSRTRANRL